MVEQQEYTTNPKSEIDSLFDRANDYFDTRVKLFKLKAVNKSSDVVSSLVARSLGVFFLVIFIVLLNIALGLLLGDLFDSMYLGFFAIAAINLIAGLILLFAGTRWMKSKVADVLIKNILK